MSNVWCPVLELLVVLPGLLLAYFPVNTYLKQTPGKLALWAVPLLLAAAAIGGLLCWRCRFPTDPVLGGILLGAAALYMGTLRVSPWKSGTVALSVCAVFSCIKSFCRALSAALLLGVSPDAGPWLCLRAAVLYNVFCWLFTLAACYPAVHGVRKMVEDAHFAQTWYVFWVLPLVFIALNLFMIPNRLQTLYTGRVLQGYLVISAALLVLLLWFYGTFWMIASSLNRNARLQRENQLLSMQQQRYESLKTAIAEARQARHDLRHHFHRLSALAEAGDLAGIRQYLAETVSRIPSPDMGLCDNRAADGVISYYCALARREGIPFEVRLDLPEQLSVNEMDMCLVLSNLLENALEASLWTEAARRRIGLTAYLHGEGILLIQVENACDGIVREQDGVFRSSKRKGAGVGIESVRHIAEKSGGVSSFFYENGVFRAQIMLCGPTD